MYSCCLICHRDLGQNDVLASFPIGERIAFSPEEGRLWAICEHCGEWNLAPIDNRWEAVEESGQAYDSAIERASTDRLSIAREGGLELLRVGPGDELPTLRYGARLWRRHKRHVARRWLAGLSRAMAYVGLAWGGWALGGPAGLSAGLFVGGLALEIAMGVSDPTVAGVTLGDGRWVRVSRRELLDARLVPHGEDGWRLRIRKGLELQGPDALEAARLMLPLLTRSKDPHGTLRRALRYIDKKGGTTDAVFAAAARRRGRRRTARISKLEVHIRLALEMLASRAVETRAVSQSLSQLHRSWESAQELAEIQDELSYGPGILATLRRLRG